MTPGGITLYFAAFGVQTELMLGTATQRWTDYLSVGNQLVGARFLEVQTETVTTRYFHTDHLGSVTVITSETGTIVERHSYDARGRRRYVNGTDDPPPPPDIVSLTTRGFTGQEQLSVGEFVHLNGRIYDPLLGRMLSADPVVPDALNAQMWNRYSYVGNSPLVFTDPSGHFFLASFFRAIVNAIKAILQIPIVRAVVQVALAVIMAPLGPAAAAISAAVVTGLAGGDLGDIFKAALITAATAFAFNNVGNLVQAVAQDAGSAAAGAVKVATHAGIGCVAAVASGGKCGGRCARDGHQRGCLPVHAQGPGRRHRRACCHRRPRLGRRRRQVRERGGDGGVRIPV